MMQPLPWLEKGAVRSVLFYEQYPTDSGQHQQDSAHYNCKCKPVSKYISNALKNQQSL